jgi:predicted nucleotide-binding protein
VETVAGVDLGEPESPPVFPTAFDESQLSSAAANTERLTPSGQGGTAMALAIGEDERRRKVFVTHGNNRDLVEPIKKLLEFGEMIPVVSVEKQSVSKPVPEKVMDDMRMCGAAIIHVDADQTLIDESGVQHVFVNPNVLIEIGAAMAFYGKRFILLVRDGVALPSNLQGLYEVRYSGESIDANATIRLLEAIRDIKNHGLPTDPRMDYNE